jgi:hypothetical protein
MVAVNNNGTDTEWEIRVQWYGHATIGWGQDPSQNRCSRRTYTVDPRKILALTYDQSLELRPAWPVKATLVTTRMAFVSFSLSPDTRVCGRNSGQYVALYH